MNANWRSPAAQAALIQLATNTSLPIPQRVDAVDALGYATRLQVKGFQQDPAMFAALVSLLNEDGGGPVRAAANILLSPAFTPLPVEREGRVSMSRSPLGGWDGWIEEITARAAGPMHSYAVCNSSAAAGQKEAVQLFCRGGEALKKNPAEGFKLTMQAAEAGYVPAQMMTGMLYSNGKGVTQDYAEGVKWFIKAAEAGNVEAASYASMALKSGHTGERDRELTAKWTAYVEEHAPQLPH
jgi:TPR repeat protein